ELQILGRQTAWRLIECKDTRPSQRDGGTASKGHELAHKSTTWAMNLPTLLCRIPPPFASFSFLVATMCRKNPPASDMPGFSGQVEACFSVQMRGCAAQMRRS